MFVRGRCGFTHDRNGNRISAQVDYEYDDLYRLVREHRTPYNGGDAGVVYDKYYVYDAAGNRLSLETKDEQGNRLAYIEYTYDAANKMLTAGNSTFTYDDKGNTLTETNGSITTTYTWDHLNRLTQWAKTGETTQAYVYNADGMRVRITPSGGAATNFLLDGNEIVEKIVATAVTTYISPDLISEIEGTDCAVYHMDGIGNTRVLTNDAGNISSVEIYDAYGNTQPGFAIASNFGFAGQYRYYADATGLDYVKARYYDPSVGRFTSRDPIGYAGGKNLYAYVSNSPTRAVDPTGLATIYLPPPGGWPVFPKPPIWRVPIGPKVPIGGWIGIIAVGVCAADVVAIIVDSCGINGSWECAKQALKDTCDGAGPDPCRRWWDPRNLVDLYVKGCACGAYNTMNNGFPVKL